MDASLPPRSAALQNAAGLHRTEAGRARAQTERGRAKGTARSRTLGGTAGPAASRTMQISPPAPASAASAPIFGTSLSEDSTCVAPAPRRGAVGFDVVLWRDKCGVGSASLSCSGQGSNLPCRCSSSSVKIACSRLQKNPCSAISSIRRTSHGIDPGVRRTGSCIQAIFLARLAEIGGEAGVFMPTTLPPAFIIHRKTAVKPPLNRDPKPLKRQIHPSPGADKPLSHPRPCA